MFPCLFSFYLLLDIVQFKHEIEKEVNDLPSDPSTPLFHPVYLSAQSHLGRAPALCFAQDESSVCADRGLITF